MVPICGFGVGIIGGLVLPICGLRSGGARRNLTGPFSLPLEITASNNFGSGSGWISTIRKWSLLGSDVTFCTSLVSVFWTKMAIFPASSNQLTNTSLSRILALYSPMMVILIVLSRN